MLYRVSSCSDSGMAKPENQPTESPPPFQGPDTQAKFVIGCSDEDFEEPPEEAEVLHVVPPDGGWGWVVVAASFMCNAIVDGVIFTSGMMYEKMRESFGASNQEVAWISSLLGGFYLIVGPFVSALANAFGFRTVCILGGILAACSCGISYFATNIYYLYGSYGILGGMGFGLIYVPAVIATGFYFEKRRALATGIAVCGSGIGTFVIAPINTYILTSYPDRWNIIFLVYAGIILSCGIFGLAFRPLSAATGKRCKQADDDLEIPGTPLLIRIKRARDHELAQCPSAISMNSNYSTSPSKVNLEEQQHLMNGDLKISVAKTLLERHGGVLSKRSSYPTIVLTSPEPILEESEHTGAEDDSKSHGAKNGGPVNKQETEAPLASNDGQQSKPLIENGDMKDKLLLDKNKNETSRSPTPSFLVRETSLTVGRGPKLRNMSAPSLALNPNSISAEIRRRPSRVALRTEVSRPFYRNDIFYSGSLARLPQYQSSDTVDQYHASVTNIPPLNELMDNEDNVRCCSCVVAMKHVLLRIFDFKLMTSVTFIMLSISGFMALMALFVPFNFLPSYTADIGISAADRSFIMSLIGICNTVGRIMAGWISDHPKLLFMPLGRESSVDALLVNNIALIIGGVATILLPFVTNLSLLYCYAVVFGLSIAAFASLRSILLVELLGLEKLTNAFGLLLLFQGFAALFGSPIAGAFVDATNEYKLSFYVFGAIFALSGVICMPLRHIKKWEDDRLDRKLRKEKYGVE